MTLKAIIFDLDGTLLDTIADLASASNHVLRGLGHPEHSVPAYKHFVGDGIEALARRALPPLAQQREEISQCVELLREEYGRRWADTTGPYPGVPELLNALEERMFPKAILTNKPHRVALEVVRHLLPNWRFAVIQGATDSVPRKPDPTSALTIARQLALEPAQILYLGDTNTDMKTAQSAGMYAVGALWGFRDAEELQQSGARALIENPMELLQLI